ncbi:DUF6305 family protein [Fusibacter bizertensis]
MINRAIFRKFFLIAFGVTAVFIINFLVTTDNSARISTNASNIQPISNEMLLITSAGQSTDTYILQDIANDLRLNNLFMPQATSNDLEDVSAIIIVVGYSDIGLKIQEKSYEDEYRRIKTLIEDGHQSHIPVVAVYLGGSERRNTKTDDLIKITCTNADYIICTNDGNHDDYIGKIAESNTITISLIESINDLTKPLALVFR